MLVPMRAILDAADKNGYAQGAFNVNAVCQVKAKCRCSSDFKKPCDHSGSRPCKWIYGWTYRFR